MATNGPLDTLSKLIILIYCCCFGWCQPFPHGVVKPGDPFKFIGQTLELYCNITDTNIQENSSMLYFERNTSTESERLVPREFIEILTTKSIRLRIPNLKISDDGVYTCLQKKFDDKIRIIGHQIVQVDYKPRKVEEISCRVYNWMKMKCVWQLGVNYTHPEHINVSVVWTVDKQQYDCPKQTKTSCLWQQSEYQHGHQYYMAVIVKTVHKDKVLEEATSKPFKIETDYYVEPDPVNNLMAAVENSTCVRLTWQHSSLKAREKYFVAEYRSKWEERWKKIILNQAQEDSLVCGLTPFTNYEFRMAVLPYPVSTDKHVYQGYRSEWKTVSAMTEEDVPGAAPKTCPSCYYELKCSSGELCREIRIYWQDLPEKEKHGEITSYNVSYTGLGTGEVFHKILHANGSQALTSAELDLSNPVLDYQITIAPATSVGASASSTSLYIPSLVNKPPPPQSFLVERDGRSEDGFTFFLSWAATDVDGPSRFKFTNISIVWCLKSSDFKCKDEIHWITLPADQVTYELRPEVKDSNPDSFLIGISAEIVLNGKKFASGIDWSSCIYRRNSEPLKAPVNVHFSASHPDNGLTVLWNKFACAEEKAFVTEYLVKYCPVDEGKTCKGPAKFKSVSNMATEVILKNLTPETRYSVSVSAMSSAGSGPDSKSIARVVKGHPPEQDEGESIITVIGITISVVVILVFLVCIIWYWRQRKSKIPVIKEFIEPYVESQTYPKKSQDFRNRPLPKTPSEEQHFYGSSACMNNHGSDKVTSKSHSESSSEDSITSQTNLISKNQQCPNLSSGGSNQESGTPYFKLKDFGHPESRDTNVSKKETEALLSSNSLEKDFTDGSDTMSANMTIEDYMRLGLNSGSGSLPVQDERKLRKLQKDMKNTPTLNEFTNSSTLPLRIVPQTDVVAYQVSNDNINTFNPLQSSVSGGHGSASDIVSENADRKKKPKNPNYIRKYRPSLYDTTLSMPTDASQPSAVEIPPKCGYVSHIPDNTQNIDNSQASKPDSNNGYVTNLPHVASDIAITSDDSRTIVPQRDKRRSVPLETVMNFPPPPTTPPPSPSPGDIQYAGDTFLSPSSLSSLPTDYIFSPSTVPSFNIPLETKQSPAVNTHGYIPHDATSSMSTLCEAEPHHVKNNQDNEQNSDVFSHSSAVLGSPNFQSHAGNKPLLSNNTMPRAGNNQTYGQNVVLLPLPASSWSRPLSGDLLELPPEYYEDPKLGGSNQILTEL